MLITTAPAVLAASNGAPAWLTYVGIGIGGASGCATAANFVWTRLRENRQERRGYADHVAAWTGPPDEECEQQGEWGHHFHTVIVHNGSAQPVYSVVVDVDTAEDGETRTAVVAVGLVPPGERVEREIGHIGQVETQFPIPLEVHFTDAHGVKWHRDSAGRLRKSETDPDGLTGPETTE